jgi:hypothetical protein
MPKKLTIVDINNKTVDAKWHKNPDKSTSIDNKQAVPSFHNALFSNKKGLTITPIEDDKG